MTATMYACILTSDEISRRRKAGKRLKGAANLGEAPLKTDTPERLRMLAFVGSRAGG
jgi:hypothetical protein